MDKSNFAKEATTLFQKDTPAGSDFDYDFAKEATTLFQKNTPTVKGTIEIDGWQGEYSVINPIYSTQPEQGDRIISGEILLSGTKKRRKFFDVNYGLDTPKYVVEENIGDIISGLVEKIISSISENIYPIQSHGPENEDTSSSVYELLQTNDLSPVAQKFIDNNRERLDKIGVEK